MRSGKNISYDSYTKKHQRKKLWQRIVSALTSIVVFCTTYALILPAITLSGHALCGHEEHSHTENCYISVDTIVLTCSPVHSHSGECYDAAGNLICGLAEYVLHSHDSGCYNEEGVLVCTLPQIRAHVHTDGCYEEQIIEVIDAGHTHAEACYELVTGEVIPGHVHEDGCYATVETLVCIQEEGETHQHGAECFSTDRSLTCQLEETTDTVACETVLVCLEEEREAEVITETILICDLEEREVHTHSAACYGGDALICGKLEISEHAHSEECTEAQEVAVQACILEEHVHDLSCYADTTADLEAESVWMQTMTGVELTENVADNLAAIALTQIGYAESAQNYIVADDGATLMGYSRYGQWAGDPYGQWNGYFVEFCLHYAEVDATLFPRPTESKTWLESIEDTGYFADSDYTPKTGDLIFVETEEVEYVGIVSGVNEDGYVTAIFGDYRDEVRRDTFTHGDYDILGYAMMPVETDAEQDDTPPEALPPEETTGPGEETNPAGEGADSELPHINATMYMVLELEDLDADSGHGSTSQGRLWSSGTSTASDDSGSIDMTDFITNVTVYYKSTGWGDTWKELTDPNIIKDGDLVRFGISYEIPGGTLSAENNSISYQLPLTSLSEAKSGEVTNSNGEVVGSYTISQTGLITITFMDRYVEENANGVVIDGTINLDTEASALQTDSDGNIRLEFTDDQIVDIKIQQTIKDDLTVEKSAGTVNDDGTVTYTITVNSKNGTAADVVLSDWMNNVTYLDDLTILYNNSDVTSNYTEPAAGSTGLGLTLPQMYAGDSYTITYTGIISEISNGTATAGNGVTVTSTDSEGNTLTDSADARVDYTDNTLNKEYTLASDGKVNWTITIGRTGESLKGWVLSDTINGATLQESVTIVYTDENGNTVTASVQLPYEFPDGACGPVTVTYTTTLDYNIGANNLYNTAKLVPPSGKPVYSDSVSVQDPNNTGTYYPLDKGVGDLTVTEDSNGNKIAVVDWTYSINASAGGIYVSGYSDGTYWYFADTLQNGQYFTADQWTALCSNLQAAMISAFNDSAVYNVAQWNEDNINQLYSITPTYSGDKIIGYTVKVYQNMLKGTKINFAYQSSANLGDGSTQQHFQNQANVNNKTWDSAGIDYYPAITKLDGYSSSASDSSHAYMDLTDGVISWKIQSSLPVGTTNVVITEDLPDDLELYSLKFRCRNGNYVTLTLYGETSITYTYWDSALNTNVDVSGTVTTKDLTTNGDKAVQISISDSLMDAFGGNTWDILVETKLHTHGDSCLRTCTEEHTHTDSCYSCDKLTAEDLGKEGSMDFSNSVSVSYKDENSSDKTAGDTHTQTITNEDTTQQLVKTAGTYSNNKIPYTVEINPNGSDLAEGDTLTINDLLYFWKEKGKTLLNATLLNVDVSVVNSDGSLTPLNLAASAETVDNNSYYYTYVQYDTYDENSYNTWYQEFHEMTFIVPDETHLVITYEYLLTGTDQTATSIYNTSTIKELTQNGSSGTSQWYTVQESAATAELKSIYVYKVDKDNYANHLSGARFELYKWNASTEKWEYDHIVESGGASELELLGLSINQAYYLIEVEAPDGYVLDQTRHYFMLYDSTKSYMYAPDDFPTTAYYTQGRSIYITNEKLGTSVSAKKLWQDASGNTIDAPAGSSVDVQLMQVWNRYPEGFDMTTLGNTAAINLAFGEYSSDTKAFGPVTFNARVGDIVYVTLKTKDNQTWTSVKTWDETSQSYKWVDQYVPYPAGLMEVTGTANNHVPYTKSETADSNGYYTYTFSYLVTSTEATLRGWVYPENNTDGNKPSVSYSIASYSTLSNTSEKVYGTVTLSASNVWNYTWSNLPEYELDSIGRITGYYSYYVQETAINGATGYAPIYTTASDGTLVITNKQVDTVDLTVVKQWADADGNVVTDTSGYPAISFELYRVESYSAPTGGTPSTDDRAGTLLGTYELSFANSWTWTSSALPKEGEDANGNTVYYTYYIRETVPTGYDVSYSTDGNSFTSISANMVDDGTVYIRNTDNGKIAIEVEKVWVDTNGTIIDAPVGSIEVELFKWVTTGGTTGDGTTDGGTTDGGTTDGGTTDGEGTTTSAKTVTVNFYETGIYDWTANDNTPKVVLDNVAIGSYIKIQYITYEKDTSYILVGETKVENAYSYEFVGYADWDSSHGYPLNRYTFYVQVTDDVAISVVTGTADYNTVIDANNSTVEGLTINLVSAVVDALPTAVATAADDTSSGSWSSLGTYDLTAANGWKYLIENLEPGTYKIEEVTTGYTVTYTVNGVSGNSGDLSDDSTVVITNKVGTETVNVPVNKRWFAADGVSEQVPDDVTSIQFYLKQNGIALDADTSDEDIDPYTLTADNNWEMTIYGLPKYDSNGAEYQYTVEEIAINGYATTYTQSNGAWTITNTSTTIDIPVDKLWFDADGTTSITPEETSIQFWLLRDGEKMDADISTSDTDPYTLAADNNWQMVIEDLPKSYVDTDGQTKDYVYTIEEVAVEGYESEVTVENGSYTITNTKLMSITVRKFWKNADGDDRPAIVKSIVFNLYHVTTVDGETVETLVTGSPFTLTATDGWQLTIENLEPGTYRLEEITTDYLKDYVQYDYSSSSGGAAGDTATFVGGSTDVFFDMTNMPYINLTVDKTWDGTPMDDLVIELQLYRMKSTEPFDSEKNPPVFDMDQLSELMADGTITLARTYTDVMSASTKWHKTFKNLPVYGVVDGVTYYYAYFVLEVTNGYGVTYSTVDAEGNYTAIATTGSMQLTNEATSIEVTKLWVDKDGNALTDVPDSITFYILQNGAIYDPDTTDDVTEPTFTLTAADNWTKVFYGLPITDANGNKYTYTIQEIAVDGYDSKVINTTVTHTATDENGSVVTTGADTFASEITNLYNDSTEISVEKVWEDGTTEAPIQVQLYRFSSYDKPSEDAVGAEGTSTSSTYSSSLAFTGGQYDSSTGSISGYWPSVGNEGTEYTAWTEDNGDGTTTYKYRWKFVNVDEYGENGNYLYSWKPNVNGCITFYITVSDAYYAIGGRDAVTNLIVLFDGVANSNVSVNYIGPDWDTSANAFTNDLRIEWYNAWNGVAYNELSFSDSLYVEFTVPTRAAVTDYPEYESNVDVTTGEMVGDYVLLSYSNSWQNTWSDLPLYGYDENGTLVYYTYYVVETTEGTNPYYSVTDPIVSGVIGITNKTPVTEEPTYELPATGGSGTFQYTLGGIFLLMAGSVVLMYNHKKGRKGAATP